MAELSLEQALGTGASQNPTTFVISKTGMAALLSAAGYTFTPKDSNSVDELLAAITCCGLAKLTPEVREADPTHKNIEFRYDPTINFSTTVLNGQTFNRHTVEVAFYKSIPTPTLNPSDY
jgi:hypothetical protein